MPLRAGLSLVALVTLSWIAPTVAQSSNVTKCIPRYDWSLNSRGQTPCLVAAYLENVCSPDKAIAVNAIPPNNHYLGPTFTGADICTCNLVVYSLISACGGCQGRTFTNWGNWTLNCVAADAKSFPRIVPAAVEVPSWAYLDISLTNNTFSPAVAEAVSKQADETPSDSTSPTHSSLSGGPAISPTPTQPPPPGSSSSRSNAGAIAGGVVGGVAFLAIAILAVFWFFLLRRRNARNKRHSHRPKINLAEDSAQPPTMHEHEHDPFATRYNYNSASSYNNNFNETREYDRNVFSPVTMNSSTFTGPGRNSMDSIPSRYAGSQLTRGAYYGAAEL